MSSYTPADTDAPCRPAPAAVRAGIDRDTAYGAVTPPSVLSSNFSFAGCAPTRPVVPPPPPCAPASTAIPPTAR